MNKAFFALFIFSVVAAFLPLVYGQDFREFPGEEGALAGGEPLTALTRVFSVADKPSEFTFTRTFTGPFNTQTNVGAVSEVSSFKISGKLKEIDANSGYERLFEFQNGTIEWNVEHTSDDADTRCRRTQKAQGIATELISNLDILYDPAGRYPNGTYAHLDRYDLKLKYVKQGIMSGKPELSIVGEVLIPIELIETATPIRQSTNIMGTCNGNTEPASVTLQRSMSTRFPLTLVNFDSDKVSQNGQLVVSQPTNENPLQGEIVSTSHDARFTSFVYISPVSLGGDNAPWTIEWKAELPNPGEKIRKIIETLEEIDTDGDRLTDLEEQTYGTDINDRDTDGDGLLDSWEVKGVYIGGVNAVDLPSMGSHPLKQDVFLEIDWMQANNHSHKPEDAALQRVINAFADRGIRLHIDIGQWGGGNSVPEQPSTAWHEFNFVEPDEKPNYLDNNRYLFDIKKDNFDEKRISIFYYGIFAHQRNDSSGQAEVGGNFFVALPFDDTIPAKSGTLMHEFGHTLQLGHGGRLDRELQYDNTHFKPNYRSVMNYHFQFNGVPFINASGDLIYRLDYSDEELLDLNESSGLNEVNGLTSANSTAVSYYTCLNNGHGINASDIMYRSGSNLVPWFVLNGSPVDWNCDGVIGGSPAISVNGYFDQLYNNSGPLQFLEGRSDWDKIVLKIGCGAYGIEDAITEENIKRLGRLYGNCSELADIRASLGYVGGHENPQLPPRYPFLGEACDGVDNDADGGLDEGCGDRDDDGVVDDLDNCIYVANADQRDSNMDFVGDACAAQYFFNVNITTPLQGGEVIQGEHVAEQVAATQSENGNEGGGERPFGGILDLLQFFAGIDFGALFLGIGAFVLIIIVLVAFFVVKLLSKK